MDNIPIIATANARQLHINMKQKTKNMKQCTGQQ